MNAISRFFLRIVDWLEWRGLIPRWPSPPMPAEDELDEARSVLAAVNSDRGEVQNVLHDILTLSKTEYGACYGLHDLLTAAQQLALVGCPYPAILGKLHAAIEMDMTGVMVWSDAVDYLVRRAAGLEVGSPFIDPEWT